MRGAFEEVRNGSSVRDACRKFGISPPTFYRWKRRLEEAGVDQAAGKEQGDFAPPKEPVSLRRSGTQSETDTIEQLKDENARLKQMIVDLMLGKTLS